MPIMAVLGGLVGILGFVGFTVSMGQVIASGEWRDWSLFDWILNIGFMVFMLYPIAQAGTITARLIAFIGGNLARLLSKVPLLSKIVDWLWAIKTAFKTFFDIYLMKWFVKGGIFYEIGNGVKTLLQFFTKHPILFFAMMLFSSLADGVASGLFQLWGDLSLRAANAAFEAVSKAMNDRGYGDPISESIAILNGSKSTLPPCFTAVWGAVGASECVGLVVTTFQYLALFASLRVGYRLYGKNGV